MIDIIVAIKTQEKLSYKKKKKKKIYLKMKNNV